MVLLLQVRQAAGLGVDILHLARADSVEIDQLLPSRGVGGLLEVRAEAEDEAASPLRDVVRLVGGLGLLGGVVLVVEALERRHEAVGDTVLLIQLDTTLEGGIADDIAVGKVLGQDADAGLLFLGDLVAVAVGICRVGSVVVLSVLGNDLNLRAAELGVVQELSGLGSSLLLEDNGGILSTVGIGGDL